MKHAQHLPIISTRKDALLYTTQAAIESFFGHFKCEAIYPITIKTLEQLREAVDDYIDFYNHERPQLRLEGKAPVEYLNGRI
jgi:transposase InsO family protein